MDCGIVGFLMYCGSDELLMDCGIVGFLMYCGIYELMIYCSIVELLFEVGAVTSSNITSMPQLSIKLALPQLIIN